MAKASTEKKPYIAKTAIQHDKDAYQAGEELELTDAEAKQLLEVKAIEPAPARKAEKPKEPTGGDQGGKPPKTEKGKENPPQGGEAPGGSKDGKPAEGLAQS